MPFKSEKQRRWMHINEPEIAQRWEEMYEEEMKTEEKIVGKNVLINQVGCYGLYMGKIDFFFDSNKSKKVSGTTILV